MFNESARYPQTMQSLPNWILWKREPDQNGRGTKVPYSALYHGKVSTTNPKGWTTFDKALKEYKRNTDKYSGIGFVLSKDTGLVFVDIDHCIDSNGEPDERAKHILSEIGENAYIEISPSGTGLHLFVKGTIPSGFKNSKKNVEMYDRERYSTMTGDVFSDHNGEPSEKPEALKRLYEEYRTRKPEREEEPAHENRPSRFSDAEVIEKAGSDPTSGEQFRRLFDGDWKNEYESQSEADGRLCQILAFWCNGNRDQILRLWKDSKLYRKKTDRTDYQKRTLSLACSGREFYDEFTARKRAEDLKAFEGESDPEIREAIERLKPDTNPKYNRLDDASNGEFFHEVFKDKARYNSTAKNWYVYDGTVWREDVGSLVVQQYAIQLYKELHSYKAENADFQKRVLRLANISNRKKMLEDARSFEPISAEMLDADRNLFNVKNGVLKLDTRELIPHNGELLLSKCANVEYDPDAESLEWLTFIDDIMCEDKSKTEYLQKVLSLGLTCNTSEEECYILFGSSTRNGKSTLSETVCFLLGDYALNMNAETLAQRKKDSRQASGDIARLKGCRFLRVPEPPKKMLLDTSLLKNFLGRDTITARNLFERESEFVPVFTLYIITNHLPIVNDDTVFSSGRIKVITFDRHFEEDEQDKRLKEKLQREDVLSGVLNWLLEGLRLYQMEGLEPPQSVKKATEIYRENSDKLKLFIDDMMVKDEKSVIPVNALHRTYTEWCKGNNFGEESKRTFIEELKTHSLFSSTGTIDGKTVRNVVKGYRVIHDFELEEIPEEGQKEEF